MKAVMMILWSTVLLSAPLLCRTTKQEFPVLKGPYLGQKPAGEKPEVFAPGIVSSSEATEYGIAFTPNEKDLYFNRNGVGIMVCTWDDSNWTPPIKAPFQNKTQILRGANTSFSPEMTRGTAIFAGGMRKSWES
jgi:hypothetical protein